jgi:heme/copper-type cytochrome/quinol oxidase subunit 2
VFELAQRLGTVCLILLCLFFFSQDTPDLNVELTDDNGAWVATYEQETPTTQFNLEDGILTLPAGTVVSLSINSEATPYEVELTGTPYSVLVGSGHSPVLRFKTGELGDTQLVSEQFCGGQFGTDLTFRVVTQDEFAQIKGSLDDARTSLRVARAK